MRRFYGIFGGTFDPIHNGHIETVSSVTDSCLLQGVRFIPSFIPPHRDQPGASAQHRLAMTRLGIGDDARFCADSRELERETTSYTFDTVKSLQREYPTHDYCFILGIDALLGVESWYRWQALLDAVHLLVMARPGWDIPSPAPPWLQQRQVQRLEELQEHSAGHILFVPVEPNPVSATQVRERIACGQSIEDLVPAAVASYINTHRLYQAGQISNSHTPGET